MATWNEILMTMGQGLAGASDFLQDYKNSDGRTNPNAKPGKKGKNAKSNKAGKRAADRAMQQQMQADQFKFLQDNIFDRTGATRRTISGQIERDVPQGMDYFKNTGPDRPELVDRQNRLNNQGLKNPWFEANARKAVDLARRKQAEPPLFPGPQNTMTEDQRLRAGGNGVEVFDNPLFSQSNPRTQLNTNTGPFVRSMEIDPRYQNGSQTARALFTPQQQAPTQQPAPGPVQSLFTPQQTGQAPAQTPSWDTGFLNNLSMLPQNQQPQQVPAATTPPTPANPAASFGVPNVQWSDLVPQENSPPLFDLFQTGANGQESFDWNKLFNLFTPQPAPSASDFKMPPLGF
jgi:hypothetical protein